MSPRRALAALLLVAVSAAPAHAYFEETIVGARGLALGNAAIAAVHDASAYYWNPAGLSDLSGRELLVDYAKPYALADLSGSAAVFATHALGSGWAVAWHHFGLSGTYGEDQITLATGRRLVQIRGGGSLAGGLAVRTDRIAFDAFTDPDHGTSVSYGSQSRFAMDAGLLWTTPWNIDIAYVGRDLTAPHFEFIAGSGGQTLATRHQLAAAFRWNRESTVTVGWSQLQGGETSFNAGLEILFYNVFAVRSGFSNLSKVYQSYGDPNQLQFTGGFGVFHKGYFVDATATTNRDLGASYHLSVRLPLGRSGSTR